ncbi:hypothetical protein [Helicobacter pylori]|uniref:Uncharacterized protein n=1 Tax=Helicobacter pylori TaxID=210 RepID=A0A4Y4XKI9_HELPX|nr:hypothetical protein [Helicobacter pylori]OOQ40102.1 hypothetical protein B0X68_03020 [Helicobacter pylori]RPF68165.1 hypothetical protein EGV97_07545 [Helicobacter pylori]
MENQKLRFFGFLRLLIFLFKAVALSIFESLKCFLKSFHSLRAYLSVTLLAHFNKNRLIFLVTLR